MADQRLTQQPLLNEKPHIDDVFHVVDVSDTTSGASGTSKKVPYSRIVEDFVLASSLADVATSGSYNDLLNVPATFTPAPHTHAIADIINLQSELDGKAGTGDIITLHSELTLDDGTNPHGTTKSDVGLSNVDNTSDLDKPISTATQSALNDKADTSSLSDVATTGDYNDLLNQPTIPDTSNLFDKTTDTLDDITAGTTNKHFTDTEKSKLAGIADNATANQSDAFLLNRDNHTGTQTASTISDFDTAVSANSDVVANTAKVSNATHTGDVTGSTALTIADGAVTYTKTSAGVQSSLDDADSSVQSITAGDDIDVDNTDARNPIISASKNATFTVELIDDTEVDFYAPKNLQIDSATAITASPTITVEVNDASYTFGNAILQGDKVTVSVTVASVVNLAVEYA